MQASMENSLVFEIYIVIYENACGKVSLHYIVDLTFICVSLV